MKSKHIPLRKCSGCAQMKPKSELVRIVRSPDIKDDNDNIISKGNVFIDDKGKANGRGAYLCLDLDCFLSSKKARRLERALSTNIPSDVYDELLKRINERDTQNE